MSATNTIWPITSLAVAASAALGGWWLGRSTEVTPMTELPAATAVVAAPDVQGRAWPLKAPDRTTIPDGPRGDAIQRGLRLLEHTSDELPGHVGASMRCTSCHLDGGTTPDAGPWVGIAGVFPEYRERNGKMNTLEERVNDCFERSMNGSPLPVDGPEMGSILAAMTWMSEGVPVGVSVEGRGFKHLAEPLEPNVERGRDVYTTRCAACHGADGQGLHAPDGRVLFPPLWGERSFNVGAGMARLDTAAAFVRWKMPLGQGGTLTDQEATDVAAYFTTQPRPDFTRKGEDWPNGGKPRDARY